jgi:hypothetical protein
MAQIMVQINQQIKTSNHIAWNFREGNDTHALLKIKVNFISYNHRTMYATPWQATRHVRSMCHVCGVVRCVVVVLVF